MPRKVDPHWGEDGFDDPESFELTSSDAKELARMLIGKPDPLTVKELQCSINEIGTQYRNWRHRGASAFTRAQARKALEELLKCGDLRSNQLLELNERAFDCLHNELLMTSPAPVTSGDTVLSALVENRLPPEALQRAIEAAIDRLKATKGPDRDGEVPWAVAELCRLYENMTGARVTHSSNVSREYQGDPRSEAGRFVLACFRHLEGANIVPDSQISNGMRLYIERRN